MCAFLMRHCYIKLIWLWTLLLCALFWWSVMRPPTVQAVAPQKNQLTLREATATTALIELVINDYSLQTVDAPAGRFHQINMTAAQPLDQPGAPALPFFATTLGLAATTDLKLEIVQAEYQELAGYRLLTVAEPVVTQADFADPTTFEITEKVHPDPAIYGHDDFYPAAPAALGAIDYLRNQPVVTLALYPVRYNPVQQRVRIYQRLVVRVSWAAPIMAAATQVTADSPVYETLMQQSLLNYAALQRPQPVPDNLRTAQSDTWANTGANTHADQVAEGPKVKIGINQRGIYRITYEELPAAFRTSLTSAAAAKLTLHNRGQAVASQVQGEADGRFGPGDALLFYGLANDDAYVPTIYTTTRPYTTTNVYWLSLDDNNGVRIPTRDQLPIGPVDSTFYSITQHAEENTTAWPNMPGNDAERWFWDRRLTPNTERYPISRTYAITLNQIADTDAPVTIRVRLKGVTFTPHQTTIRVNGIAGTPLVWQDQAAVIQRFSPADNGSSSQRRLLHEGVNQIVIETSLITTAIDQIVVDWIEIDHWRRYVANDGELFLDLPAQGAQTLQLSGFTGSTVELWNVTNPQLPVRIGYRPEPSTPAGAQAITFRDQLTTKQQYFAQEIGANSNKPAYIKLDTPSALRATPNQATYLIITHHDFLPAAERLAAHRRSTGNNVGVIDVEDLYDEFSDGILSPVAIRDFLAHTRQAPQSTTPSYVLFLGDANGDFLDYAHSTKRNFVPTQSILSRFFGEVPSDAWLVELHNTGFLPDVMAGRLPAQTLAQAEAMVDKIIGYETAAAGEWQRHVLLVADNDIDRFESYAQDIAAKLPTTAPNQFVPTTVFPAQYATQTPRTLIAQALNAGQTLVTYFGHGAYAGWGTSEDVSNVAGYMFHNDDIAQLTNRGKLPVVTMANCLNGFFNGSVAEDSIAELFVRTPQVGAVAAFAPSAYERPSVHERLMRAFYNEIFVNHNLVLGSAALSAQNTAYDHNDNFRDLLTTYILFGDPATKLRIAANPPRIKQTIPDAGASAVEVDEPLGIIFSKKMNRQSLQIESSPPVNFTPTWIEGDTVLQLKGALAYGTPYTVRIRANDLADPPVGPIDFTWSFTTTFDQPPTVAILIHRGVPSATSPNAQIQLTFSEPVVPTTVEFALVPQSGGGAVRGFLQWIDEQRAFFIHDPFVLKETYTFTILNAEDRTDKVLPAVVERTFTVGEPVINFLPIIAR